jgi:hypothetical protein
MRIAEGVGSANAARGPVGRGNVASLLQTRSSSSPAAPTPCREQPGPRYRHLQNTDVGPRAPLGSGGPPELWARVRAHIFRTSRIPAARLVLSMSSDRCTCRESVGSFGLLATRLKSAREATYSCSRTLGNYRGAGRPKGVGGRVRAAEGGPRMVCLDYVIRHPSMLCGRMRLARPSAREECSHEP